MANDPTEWQSGLSAADFEGATFDFQQRGSTASFYIVSMPLLQFDWSSRATRTLSAIP